ncbi:MAG: dTMP kinase [Elusimicrobiota bacterium]
MRKGFFITLEGPDGCGKTTQSKLLIKKLEKLGFDIVHTREPGGTLFSETIRKILLNPKNRICPLAELLFYEACRAQHTKELILPAIKSGKIVICERYADASVAYQGFGRGLDIETIMQLNKIATDGCEPDLTIYFDADIKKGLARAQKRGKDRLENENYLFHKKVRNGYRWLAKKFTNRIKEINASDTIENIATKVFDIVIKKTA